MEQMTSIMWILLVNMQRKEEERRNVRKQAAKEYMNEVRKNEQAYNEEQYSAARRRKLSIPFLDEDDYISLGDIIARYSTTILETESDEVIKSSVENLVPIPSEFEGISNDTSDVPDYDNNRINVEIDLVESLINRDTSIVYSSKIDPILEEFIGELAQIAPIPPGIVEAKFDPNDDTSSDDDSFKNIEYVDASPSYSELDSLEEENEDQEEKEFNLEDIFQIQDVILREKLLNVHCLISNIESLKDNPIPDRVLESPSLFPIPVADSDSFLEESNTSFSHLDNSLPEFETLATQKRRRREVAVPHCKLITALSRGTDKTKITRKPSKRGNHGHEERKSVQEPEAKVKKSTSVNSQSQH
ncbi:hypothetical protein Tco_0596763 [Tanacetum coccineum]